MSPEHHAAAAAQDSAAGPLTSIDVPDDPRWCEPRSVRAPFTRPVLDRCAERRTGDVALHEALADPATAIVLVADSGVAVDVDDAAEPIGVRIASPAIVQGALSTAYLGRTGGRHVVAARMPSASAELDDPGYHARDPRDLLHALPADQVSLAIQAVALLNWHRSMRHCPRCGALLDVVDSGWVMRCPEDGSPQFPRTDPAVIMAIRDGADRLLLARNVAFPRTGMHSILAGYVEPGETIENAVAREAREETGVRVTRVEYAGSQPWPYPCSLMLGFRAWTDAVADSSDLVLQADEIADARWYSRDDLTAALAEGRLSLPPDASISRALIDQWRSEGGGTLDAS